MIYEIDREKLRKMPCREVLKMAAKIIQTVANYTPVDDNPELHMSADVINIWLQGTEVKSDAARGLSDAYGCGCDADVEHPERPQDCELFESTGVHCKDCIKADELSTVDYKRFPEYRAKGA